MRPSTASPIYLCAYFQRVLGVAPSALALDKTRQHTLLAVLNTVDQNDVRLPVVKYLASQRASSIQTLVTWWSA
jgi:hypothetical protein